MDRHNPVALITGGSGGIGAALCRSFGSAGYRIALHYSRDLASARALQEELAGRGAPCRLLRADLCRPGAAASLVRAALRGFGRLDVLVNSAGAVLGQKDFLEMPEADWERTLRLNAGAPFFLCREAFRAMRRRGGRIINISSIAAKFGGSARSMHYGAAKAALEAVTVGLARHGARYDILVNAIRPGVIDTDFHRGFKKDMARRIAMIPLKRMGRPEEVAALALHLAGPGGDFITGQVLSVTGGE